MSDLFKQIIGDSRRDGLEGAAEKTEIVRALSESLFVDADQNLDSLRRINPIAYEQILLAEERQILPVGAINDAAGHPVVAVAYLKFMSLNDKPRFLRSPDGTPTADNSNSFAELNQLVISTLEEFVAFPKTERQKTFGSFPENTDVDAAIVLRGVAEGAILSEVSLTLSDMFEYKLFLKKLALKDLNETGT